MNCCVGERRRRCMRWKELVAGWSRKSGFKMSFAKAHEWAMISSALLVRQGRYSNKNALHNASHVTASFCYVAEQRGGSAASSVRQLYSGLSAPRNAGTRSKWRETSRELGRAKKVPSTRTRTCNDEAIAKRASILHSKACTGICAISIRTLYSESEQGE